MFGLWPAQQDTALPLLIPLLEDIETTVECVLEHAGLAQGLRKDSALLFEFILDPDHLLKILQYTLTDDHRANFEDAAQYRRMQRSAINVLTTKSRKLQDKLRESATFVDFMMQFPMTEGMNDPKICGNYSQIIENMTRFTVGGVIENTFTTIGDHLIEHLDVLAFKELFLRLACEFTQKFGVTTEMIRSVVEKRTGLYCAVTTVRDMLREKPTLIQFIEDAFIVQRLMDIGVDAYDNDQLLSTEAFQLVLKISDMAKDPLSVREWIRQSVDRMSLVGEITIATAPVLDLFPEKVEQVIDRFFEKDYGTQFNQSVCRALQGILEQDRRRIVEEHQVCEKLMESFEDYTKAKTNGHFLQIVNLLLEHEIMCKNNVTGWAVFAKREFSRRYTLSNGAYGAGNIVANQGDPPVFPLPKCIIDVKTEVDEDQTTILPPQTMQSMIIETLDEVDQDEDIDPFIESDDVIIVTPFVKEVEAEEEKEEESQPAETNQAVDEEGNEVNPEDENNGAEEEPSKPAEEEQDESEVKPEQAKCAEEEEEKENETKDQEPAKCEEEEANQEESAKREEEEVKEEDKERVEEPAQPEAEAEVPEASQVEQSTGETEEPKKPKQNELGAASTVAAGAMYVAQKVVSDSNPSTDEPPASPDDPSIE